MNQWDKNIIEGISNSLPCPLNYADKEMRELIALIAYLLIKQETHG